MENLIYLDNAATTKPYREIAEIFRNCLTEFYNPSAVYAPAIFVHKKIENARVNICKSLHGEHGNVVFTANATEADNLAFCAFKPRANNNCAVFVAEHPAVYNKTKALEISGANVIYIPATKDGTISDISKYINNKTAFLSVMHVSNETGAINDIAKIIKNARKINPKIIVHVDGVQAFGKIPVNLRELDVDLYTISAHKIYGPKGVGALWAKKGINLAPIVFGGGQEYSLRSGTENVAGILSLEYCAKKITEDFAQNYEIVKTYRQMLIEKLNENNLVFYINGNGSPYILNITFEGIRGEVLLHSLEKYGIFISTGSACSSKKPDNRTLTSMGKTPAEIQSTVRISFSPYDKVDIQYVADCIATEVKDLQKKIKGK